MTTTVMPLVFLALSILLLVQRWRVPAQLSKRGPELREQMQQPMLAPWWFWNYIAVALMFLGAAVIARDNTFAVMTLVVSSALWVAMAWLLKRQRTELGLDSAAGTADSERAIRQCGGTRPATFCPRLHLAADTGDP